MGKRKKTVKKKTHTEVKGLFVLALNALSLISLLSYVSGAPRENWLGFIGYSWAFLLHYFLGLGSYILMGYTVFIGTKLLVNKPVPPRKKWIPFLTMALSLCLLMNILAESLPSKAHLFENRVYTEHVTVYAPDPTKITRHNLGGVPLYYLYRDLPFFSLQKLFSPVGSTLIFSFTAIISFFLFTGISMMMSVRFFWKLLLYFACKTVSFLAYLFHKTRYLLQTVPRKAKKVKRKRAPKPAPLPEAPEEEPADLKIHTMKTPVLKKKPEPVKLSTILSFKYALPSPRLLTDPKPIDQSSLKKDLARQAKTLEETLRNFQIEGKVGEINCGPTITSFEVQPPIGVKVQKIKALESDIALSMEAKSIRILAPIPGKAVVGVEVPSLKPQEVSFKEMLQYYQQKSGKFQIPIMLGKTVAGDYVTADLAKMPHCLIAGATGSGKSVCINTIVMSILMNARPDEVKLLMIDPKKVELTQYSNLPHMIAPVISEAHGAYAALQWLVREMQVRYEVLKELGLRNITAFNSRKRDKEKEEASSIPIPEHMPMIVAIIDEFADLMMVSSSDLETPIARIAQMARAVGIHLILATQRPSREVITGIIKANFPTRIAFKVSSRINSQIIMDETGAESLLGNGDLLFLPPGSSTLVRAQGAYISDEDINRVVQRISDQAPPNYLISSFDAMKKEETKAEGKDSLYEQALDVVLASKSASTTYLQRKLKIGYARAASLMDELEENGIVGPQEGSRPRKVLKTPDAF